MNRKEINAQSVWEEFDKALSFNEQIKLGDTVKVNEDFFIGKQWEGVQANGLPTPVFNIIKRVVLYQVATIATDNVAMAVNPMNEAYPMVTASTGGPGVKSETERLCDLVRGQFDALMESNKLTSLIRELVRDAAVRGDGCIYSWFDQTAETGQEAKGCLRCEVLENTRVYFGDPNVRQVQSQPWITVARRERIEDVRRELEGQGKDPGLAQCEGDELEDRFDKLTDDKITTLTRFEKREGTVWCVKTVKNAVVREEWDTGMTLYPFVWMSWDHVTNCYHGQAAVTGLIPNQIFINKAFAMAMISLMTTAFPKVIYNKQLIAKWDSGVGKAIAVNGAGDLNNAARTIDPAAISPQIGQFIQLAMSMTQDLMGATDAALGKVKPENTSAILALQKSSQVPMELVKQELHQTIEDLGRVWLDQMRVYYGIRLVESEGQLRLFDFAALNKVPLSLKLDVGGSAYWNEIAQLQTLDNLLAKGHINILDYLERLPNGYISNQQTLMKTIKERLESKQAAPAAVPGMGMAGVKGIGMPGGGQERLSRPCGAPSPEGRATAHRVVAPYEGQGQDQGRREGKPLPYSDTVR